MRQTRLESFVESCLNVGSGFVVSLLVWRYFVVPYLGITVSWHTNIVVTTIFTVVSIARGFIWRRLFNAAVHKRVHAALQECRMVRAMLRPAPVETLHLCPGCNSWAPFPGECPACGRFER